VITERGIPVARVPLDDGERRTTRRLRQAGSGLLRPGRGRLPTVLKKPPSGPASGAGVLEALLAERGDRSTDRRCNAATGNTR
jgi:hypothetical protein